MLCLMDQTAQTGNIAEMDGVLLHKQYCVVVLKRVFICSI